MSGLIGEKSAENFVGGPPAQQSDGLPRRVTSGHSPGHICLTTSCFTDLGNRNAMQGSVDPAVPAVVQAEVISVA